MTICDPVAAFEGGRRYEGSRSITAGGATASSFAADRFSLLALRRRSVALSLAFFGIFSLAISYIVPVAQTLAVGGHTISALRELKAHGRVLTPDERFGLQILRSMQQR